MYTFNKMRFSKESVRHFIKKEHVVIAGVALSLVLAFILAFLLPPKTFQIDTFIEVEKGTTMSEFAETLEEEGYIKSVFLFQTIAIALGGDGGLVAGDYSIEKPQSTFQLARRFTKGIYDLERIRIRLNEGESVYAYADLLDEKLPRFDKTQFLRVAVEKEGYLFPDTYIFFETADEQDVLLELETTFQEKTAKLQVQVAKSKRTWEEVVTMASIIEKEANRNRNEQQMISGILWRRIDRGMHLQVDAPFKYYMDKGSLQLTIADLRTDHEYNTYTRKGLTPTPIGNPGMSTLIAASSPISSEYVFYLHDSSGGVHYAVTHDQHVANKNAYLR
jgi:UPF0755 protein